MKQSALFNIEGHVAMVTGAGSGIGLAYAEVLAENGAKVLLTGKTPERLEAATSRLRAAGCDVDCQVLDIADTDKLRTTIDGLAAKHGRLDIMFANVGISHGRGFLVDPNGSLTAIDFEGFRRVVEDVCEHLAGKRLAEEDDGGIGDVTGHHRENAVDGARRVFR